ncbi:hypothetical protein BGZ88_010934 [Linnemannia elongata]|nr:hypothetical protein BGZ88_010934 [Linnemannia elongata]
MEINSLLFKHLRVQRPGPPPSPPVQTFFSISPPKRPQHPSVRPPSPQHQQQEPLLPQKDSTLSALLRRSSLHQQQLQFDGDKVNHNESYGDLSNSTNNIDHSNAARSANDDYGACDGLNKDQGYDQSQDRRRRSQDSATATPMDYDNNDLLDLDANLKPQLKLHKGRLDFDETKHPDYYTLYKDTTLYNLRGVIRSLTVVGALSTAAVYC